MFGVGYVSLLSLELYWNMLLSTMLQGKVWQIAIYMERHTQVMNTYLSLEEEAESFLYQFCQLLKGNWMESIQCSKKGK